MKSSSPNQHHQIRNTSGGILARIDTHLQKLESQSNAVRLQRLGQAMFGDLWEDKDNTGARQEESES